MPDGDLFKAVREGQASVVTDEIESFEPAGVRLKSGKLLEADVKDYAQGKEELPQAELKDGSLAYR